MVCANSFAGSKDLPVSIWALSSMVIQLLPRLFGKAEHLFVSSELKTLCELGEELHGVVSEPVADGTKLRRLFRYFDLHMLLLGLTLNFSSQHFLESFPVFSCFFESLCLYLRYPADAEREMELGLKREAEQVVEVHTCHKSQS